MFSFGHVSVEEVFCWKSVFWISNLRVYLKNYTTIKKFLSRSLFLECLIGAFDKIQKNIAFLLPLLPRLLISDTLLTTLRTFRLRLTQFSFSLKISTSFQLLHLLNMKSQIHLFHLNVEMEAECLIKTLSYLNLNISRTKHGRNKL